jgi:hypothetical protein
MGLGNKSRKSASGSVCLLLCLILLSACGSGGGSSAPVVEPPVGGSVPPLPVGNVNPNVSANIISIDGSLNLKSIEGAKLAAALWIQKHQGPEGFSPLFTANYAEGFVVSSVPSPQINICPKGGTSATRLNVSPNVVAVSSVLAVQDLMCAKKILVDGADRDSVSDGTLTVAVSSVSGAGSDPKALYKLGMTIDDGRAENFTEVRASTGYRAELKKSFKATANYSRNGNATDSIADNSVSEQLVGVFIAEGAINSKAFKLRAELDSNCARQTQTASTVCAKRDSKLIGSSTSLGNFNVTSQVVTALEFKSEAVPISAGKLTLSQGVDVVTLGFFESNGASTVTITTADGIGKNYAFSDLQKLSIY